ncbi:fluoride efflux transporter CrcB [Solibacillus sp. MA9]|uniref:Fluoride-specific ion channel FluC n=1 Tax=Solibacillus palustris TaxID=2908203 RepID=A0ABS9UC28_9BACL|nr:fluoride efflux transporter CrcB [Solibacillus sp. MA9]MCH7321690.1 fluoride efflux transporter CrcB [Solibacillus sp. MA9]
MIAVAIGGFFGAILRFKVSQWNQKKLKQEKFIATFLVNIIGSFLLGISVGGAYNNFITQLIAIGFLGAFTTFSTFSFEVVQLLEARRVKTALLYAISSCIVSIAFASIGYLF